MLSVEAEKCSRALPTVLRVSSLDLTAIQNLLSGVSERLMCAGRGRKLSGESVTSRLVLGGEVAVRIHRLVAFLLRSQ